MAKDVKLVHLTLTFQCDKGHPITVHHTHTQSRKTLREIEELDFRMTCPECHQEVARKGRENTSIQPVG